MLGTLSTYATTSAPRRVEPPGSSLRLSDTPEAAAPPRQTASETDNAALTALASRSGQRRMSLQSGGEGLTALLARAALESAEDPADAKPAGADRAGAAEKPLASAAMEPEPEQGGLSEADQVAVSRLSERDQEVRAHEMAHVIAGRPWAGPPVYMYQTGPDGRRYAIGGFVPIDVTPVVGDPHATAYKMRVVSHAALATSAPSAADRRVAAIAQASLQDALAAISSQSRAVRAGASPEEAKKAAETGLNVRI